MCHAQKKSIIERGLHQGGEGCWLPWTWWHCPEVSHHGGFEGARGMQALFHLEFIELQGCEHFLK